MLRFTLPSTPFLNNNSVFRTENEFAISSLYSAFFPNFFKLGIYWGVGRGKGGERTPSTVSGVSPAPSQEL